MTNSDTIAALATAAGAAAIAIIRISGPDTHKILSTCIRKPGSKMQGQPEALDSWSDRSMRLRNICDPQSQEVLDEGMVVIFRRPHSFTGEDAAELYLHGGPYIIQRVLSMLYAQGCRPADPGEFTRRAYLHGKLDLTAAEGIRELVTAQSHQQWLAARQLTTGRLKYLIEHLRQTLVSGLAYLEAQVDFPDEGDTAHLVPSHVDQKILSVYQQIQTLRKTYNSGRVASQGLKVALYGAPNTGKSTLLNTLLGQDRAIVTPIAGTTRDYIEEPCLIDGRLIRLFDLAGIRKSHDPIESIGVQKAQELAEKADLILLLIASDGPPEQLVEAEQWLATLNVKDSIKIRTKCELGGPTSLGDHTSDWLPISCHQNLGVDQLRRLLSRRVDEWIGGLGDEAPFVTTARHAAALDSAISAIERYQQASQDQKYIEILAFELSECVRALKSIIGDVQVDDILDEIFKTFCVGK